MSILQDSWSSFSTEIASKYLKGFGSPSLESKIVVTDILADAARTRHLRLIELGCGNGQLAEFFDERKLDFTYTGVDFSAPLLAAAERAFSGKNHVRFINEDVEQLTSISERYDFAIYSHVIEMLSSPEASLKAAKRVAEKIIIRFFEPPDHEVTKIDLRVLETGDSGAVPHPYLRWSMGRDFYRLMLANLGVTRVDVYRTRTRDQVHVLHFG